MASPTMQASGTQADVVLLVGTWLGIKPDENDFAKIVITEQDGTLLIQPFSTAAAEVSDWEPLVAIPHVEGDSTTATGFQAHVQRGDKRIEFLAVNNHGVLLVQAFTSFPGDGDRPGEWTKGYYRRAPANMVATTGISSGTLHGEWVNSNSATNWVPGFTITEGAGGRTIRIRSASEPVDWGEVEINAYRDKYGEAHLYAEYDLEPFRVSIGVISVKNLVVLNQFYRYKDGSLNSFCREFFFRNR